MTPAPAVARHLAQVLETRSLLATPDCTAEHRFLTSSQTAEGLKARLVDLMGLDTEVHRLRWTPDGRLSFVSQPLSTAAFH